MAAVQRYDWDSFRDGEHRVIIEGVDTRARLDSLRAQMCKEARRRGHYARTLVVPAGADSWFSDTHPAMIFKWSLNPYDYVEMREALPALRDRVRPHFVAQFPQLFARSDGS